eukprot:scaffold24618_cov127-Cylindrotheca_fusiformis.AAC.2
METPNTETKLCSANRKPRERKSNFAPKIKCAVLGGVGAGKTSILRRHFHGEVPDPDRRRTPTLGSDFFTRNISEVEGFGDGEVACPISLIVWDTPGRENLASRKSKYTAAFPDSFFRNLDVCLLIYDASSSTSFTHVLKWHADLTERIKRLQDAGERDTQLPILVAANKMDILKNRNTKKSRPHTNPNQRDVIGLKGKDFRGKDSRYEYTASQPPSRQFSPSSSAVTINTKGSGSVSSKSKSVNSKMHKKSHRNRFELSTYMGTGDQISYLEQFFNNEVKGSYLESLLSTEDGSHPDMEMVLLWCYRNGLSHHEVSALDGRLRNLSQVKKVGLLCCLIIVYFPCPLGAGIDALMNEMAKLALESRQTPVSNLTDPSKWLRQNDKLDVHRRYSTKRNCLVSFDWCCEKPHNG